MIDYCKDITSVIARTAHFTEQVLDHEEVAISDFPTYESFEKFLYKNDMRSSCGFNKNKKGYLETLHFIYDMNRKEVKGKDDKDEDGR